MIGLIDSAVASSALAPPMRPPLRRFSSVSTAPHSWPEAISSPARATTSSWLAPPAASRAQSATIIPWASDTVRPSITVTGTASNSRAPSSADCMVADSAADRHTTTTESAPSSASALVGRSELARRGRGGGRQLSGCGALGPERCRREVAAVDVLGAVDADGQRHDGDAQLVDQRLGQVARRIGDDAHAPHGWLLIVGAGFMGRAEYWPRRRGTWSRRSPGRALRSTPGGAPSPPGRPCAVGWSGCGAPTR